MFSWYATGNYSLARLEKELYEAGLRTRSGKRLGMSRIHVLLQDPFYYGKMRWKTEVYDGKQEVLINKDAFDKVQTILKRKIKNPHFRKHNSLLKAKVYCEHCGGMLTWYQQKGHWYGHCNNHGEYRKCSYKTCIRQEVVEEPTMTFIDLIAPHNKEVLSVIEEKLREQHAEKITEREREIGRIERLLTEVRKQKDKYFDAKISKEVPVEFCERKIAELTADEEALEDTLIKTSDKSDEYQQLGIAIHELAYKSKEIYEKATVDEKRLLMSQLFTNILQNRLEIKPKYTEAAEFLNEWIPKLNEDYELQQTRSGKRKTGIFQPVSPVWLRG